VKLAKLSFLVAVAVAMTASCATPKQDTAQTVLDTIFARKSVRSYTEQDVTPEQVETLLKAAMSAPSGMNLQPWRFVVVRDQEVKDKLAGPRGGMIATAPVVIVVCGQTTWTHKPFGGQPDAPDIEDPNGNWTADCAAATENLLIAVQAMGLGAVWTAAYPYPERIAVIRETLGLPENVSPYCVVPVGYPAGDDQPKDKWKPENIHFDKW
jgi:nitroreductase